MPRGVSGGVRVGAPPPRFSLSEPATLQFRPPQAKFLQQPIGFALSAEGDVLTIDNCFTFLRLARLHPDPFCRAPL